MMTALGRAVGGLLRRGAGGSCPPALARALTNPTRGSDPSDSTPQSAGACEEAVQSLLANAAERVPFVYVSTVELEGRKCPLYADDVVRLHKRSKRDGGGRVIFVDVREPPEWAESGLVEGALPMPRGVLEFVCGDRIELDTKIVLYCSNGYRAALAGCTLLDLGYTSVLNGGSFAALEEVGVSVEPFNPGPPQPSPAPVTRKPRKLTKD